MIVLPNRSVVIVSGPDAEHLLHNVLTTNFEKLETGHARPGALLTPQGKIMFDFMAQRLADGRFLLDMRSDQIEAFLKRMTLYKLRAQVDFTQDNESVVAVFAESDSAPSETDSMAIGVDSRFKKVVVKRAILKSEAMPDAQAWACLRVTHGVAESGDDYALGDAFPHDVSMDSDGGLDFKKGCYVGQEVVSRMHHRGTARRRIMIVRADGTIPASGTEVMANGKSIGTLGTVCHDQAIVIGRLDRAAAAIAKGEAIEAGGVAISVALPEAAAYQWPTALEEDDG